MIAGRAGATVGLEDVTVQDDGVLAEALGVDDRAQAAADEPADLVGASPDLPPARLRSERVLVDLGSISYSAVTQPVPRPLSHRGTPAVNEAAHRTRVRPNSTSTLPSAWSSQLRVIRTSRS